MLIFSFFVCGGQIQLKTIIFHFGVQRTGTTTLQSVLAKNKGILRSHGILYPDFLGQKNHVKMPWSLKNNKITSVEVVNEILKQDEDFVSKFVISAEDLCILTDFSFLKDFLDKFEVMIIVYLKEQSAWLESWYNQHIKWPWEEKYSSCSREYFLDHIHDFYWIDYVSFLDKIKKIIGDENLTVKINSSSLVKDTTKDFIEYIGLDASRLHPYSYTNESLTAGQLEVIRRVDLSGVKPAARIRILNAVKKMEIDGDIHGKSVFNNQQRLKIYQYFQDSNNMLFDKYFAGEKVFDDYYERNYEPLTVSDEIVSSKYLPKLCKLIATD